MARPTLTSDHVGTNPIIISERQFPTLTSIQPMIEMTQHLHLAMRGTNPPCQKALALTSNQPMIEERHYTYI